MRPFALMSSGRFEHLHLPRKAASILNSVASGLLLRT